MAHRYISARWECPITGEGIRAWRGRTGAGGDSSRCLETDRQQITGGQQHTAPGRKEAEEGMTARV